ncbi:MAG TPA: glycosyltransferase [Humisphaera sp.]|nr:glycosyltransferase [Humisphaera sp.]
MTTNRLNSQVTFLISSYNRRDVLLHTLRELAVINATCGVAAQTIVVDNASTDGTADAVDDAFADVILIRQSTNRGACSKNVGLAQVKSPYVIFLDDDSFPNSQSIRRMIQHFEADPKLGAAVFDVVLPDGTHECSAYPSVFIGCGTGFRMAALKQVGGLPEDFFMQAEEYDLSLRLLNGGWRVRRFDDLQVSHLKTPSARQPTRTTRLDVRNNLTLIARHFPRQWIIPFAIDWMGRYRWLAQAKGWRHHLAFWRGLIEGMSRAHRTLSLLRYSGGGLGWGPIRAAGACSTQPPPRPSPGVPEEGENCAPFYGRRPISEDAFEQFAMVRLIQSRLQAVIREHGCRSILLIDLGKNILPFWLAAKACGVKIIAIADPKLAGRRYRGISVVDDAQASRMVFDLAVISNISPVHAKLRRESWRQSCPVPVIDLMENDAAQSIAA